MSGWCDWGRERDPADEEVFDGAEIIDGVSPEENERAEQDEEMAERKVPWVPMQ